MKKKAYAFIIIILVTVGSIWGQTSPFEGTWTGRAPYTIFFDTLEYSFQGNIWTLSKVINGKVTELSEGTFTYTKERLLMLQTRYKTTGEWKEAQMETGGNYRLEGNKFFLDGLEFVRSTESVRPNSALHTTNTGGLYYSIILPNNWTAASNHKYLPQLKQAMGTDTARGDFTEKAYVDSQNENNFLFISEVAVPPGYTTAQAMGGTPAARVNYNGREFYEMTAPYNSSCTMKVAYIVYKDLMHGFFFILENSDLRIADQVLSSTQFR